MANPDDLNQPEDIKISEKLKVGEAEVSAEAFIAEQEPIIKTEEELTNSGVDTAETLISDVEKVDPEAANAFGHKNENIKTEIKKATSTKNEELRKLEGTNNIEAFENKSSFKEVRMVAINKATATVNAGEHWIVEGANKSIITIEPGALLTIDGANNNTIFVKKGGKVEINVDNKNRILYEEKGDVLDIESSDADQENLDKDKIRHKIAEIKESLLSIDSIKLSDKGKNNALREIAKQINELHGGDISVAGNKLIAEYPEFKEVVNLFTKKAAELEKANFESNSSNGLNTAEDKSMKDLNINVDRPKDNESDFSSEFIMEFEKILSALFTDKRSFEEKKIALRQIKDVFKAKHNIVLDDAFFAEHPEYKNISEMIKNIENGNDSHDSVADQQPADDSSFTNTNDNEPSAPEELEDEYFDNLKELGIDITEEDYAKYEEQINGRLENWNMKNVDEKKDVINNEKDNLADKLREKNKDNAQMTQRLNPEFFKKKEEIIKYQKELEESSRLMFEANKNSLAMIKGQLDGSIDTANLDIDSRGELERSLSAFSAIANNILDIERLDYISSSLDNDLGGLPDSHEERKIQMEVLEERIQDIKKMEDYLKEYERLTEKQKELLKDELVSFIDRIKGNKKLLRTLAKAGILVSIAVLASVILGPAAGPLIQSLEIQDIGLHVASGVIATAIYHRKEAMNVLKKGTSLASLGAMSAGLILSIFTSENMDNFAERITGKKLPGWSRLGLRKKGEK